MHTIKNKIDKNWKKIETTYCLGCKDYTHNYKPEEVEMRNNVLREKSNNIACKWRFLKQKHNKDK